MTTVNVTTSVSMTENDSKLQLSFSVKFKVKKSDIYSPWHFWSSYKVIFGHLYSVKLTILPRGTSPGKVENSNFECYQLFIVTKVLSYLSIWIDSKPIVWDFSWYVPDI